jgi:hypothetical protein
MILIPGYTDIGPKLSARSSGSIFAGLLAALLALVAWVYWPGLGGGFIFDDIPNIVANPALHVRTLAWREWMTAMFSTSTGPLGRPISMATFAANFYVSGLDSHAMKLTNLVIHLANVVLAYALSRQLAIAARPDAGSSASAFGLAVAALWALHPINFMGVLYVVQRMESLCQVFVLGGLWLYVIGRNRQVAGRPGWLFVLAGIGGGTVLGTLAKESAVLLPLYAFLFEACCGRFRDSKGVLDWRFGALYGGVLFLPAIVGLARVLPSILAGSAFASRDFTLAERLYTESRVVLDYIGWTAWPRLSSLGLFHDDFPISNGPLDPPSTLASIAVLVAMLVAAWALRARRPLACMGVLWFFASHLLTATVIPLELVHEHRNYFGSLGLLVALADLVVPAVGAPGRRRLGWIALAMLSVFYAGSTHLRAIEWSSPLKFAFTEASKHPTSPRATYNLALQLINLSGYKKDSALTPAVWGALENARKAPGSNALPYQASLIFAARTGAEQRQEWWRKLREKFEREPLNIENRMSLVAMTDCAVDEGCDFPPDEMMALFGAALTRGDDAGILSIYGKYALHVMKDYRLALRLWRESARLGPANPQFQINLAWLETGMGHYAEAERAIAALRALGLGGQYVAQADQLEHELERARATPR